MLWNGNKVFLVQKDETKNALLKGNKKVLKQDFYPIFELRQKYKSHK